MRQGEEWAPFTERLLRSAGIREGMRVIDYGCGAGDVSFIAADLVGPQGHVIGVDRDPAQVEFARERARTAGRTNIEFVEGDFSTLFGADAADAVVGRFVLMYQADPAEALNRALANLRPGGVCAFHEGIVDARLLPHFASPLPPPGLAEGMGKSVEALAHMIAHPDLGLRLPEVFAAAGLKLEDSYFEAGAPVTVGGEIGIGFAQSWSRVASLAWKDGRAPFGEAELAAYAEALPKTRAAHRGATLGHGLGAHVTRA